MPNHPAGPACGLRQARFLRAASLPGLGSTDRPFGCILRSGWLGRGRGSACGVACWGQMWQRVFMQISRSFRRRLVVAAVVIAVFTITGFFILPPIVKAQLEKRASAALGRQVTVEKVRVNPYALSLTLENLAVREPDGKGVFLGWQRLYVNFDALSSLWGEWVLSDVALDGFGAKVTVNPDQSLSFADILARLAPPRTSAAPPAKPARPVRVASLKVTGAKVDFTDVSRKQRFATVVGPLTFVLSEFRTVSAPGAPYRFEATTESGEKLAWSGTLQSAPLRSVGELNIANILLPKYAPYYADRMQADLAAGTLSMRGRYEASLDEAHGVFRLTEGSVRLRGLRILERASHESAVELPSLDIEGVQADLLAQKLAVRSVNLAGGHLRLRREKDGAINLLAMLQAPAETPPAAIAAAAAPTKRPDVTVDELVLKDFQVDVADLSAPRPAQLAINGLQVALKNFSLAEGARMPLSVALAWSPQGTVKIDGTVGIKPVQGDVKIEVAGLEILPLSPYLEQFVNVHVTQGALTTTLAAQVALADGQAPAATVSGDVKIEKLGLVDGAHNEELAGFGALALHGLHAATAPELSVGIDEIDVTAPYARIVVAEDKSMNLAAVARHEVAAPAPAAGGTPAPAAPAPAAPPPKIEIGKVVITDGDYRFTDRSVEPNVSMAIGQFGGTVTGLSSANLAKADVDLKAMVDGSGPVAISGKLDPLGATKSVDLKVDFKNVDLLPLSPYSGRFAGYELARGKLALEIKLLLEGKKIDSTNVVTLNQFTFGQPVKSPDATGLPVRLAVALLKDIDGKIVVDVPVQGSTDDPNFRYGKVVMRVIVNLLTKAAVSPFALLGAAFGGGGDELGYQEFAPGSAEIQPAEVKKLATMVQALTNRPGLSVGLEGGYDSAADAYALKRTKLADQVRRSIWETKHLADPNIPPPDQLVITPEENAAAIKKLFDEKFPPGTQFGTPLPAAPAVVAPPPPPPAGFFKRVVRAITFQDSRDQRAAQNENTRLAAEHTQAVAAAAATGLPVEEMTGRLAEATAVTDDDLRALAQARAQRVRDYFATTGKIAVDRLFLANAAAPAAGDSAKAGKGPRVFLQLQ